MQTTRAFGRTTVLALILSTAALFGGTDAAACDGDYEIKAGDTLGAIAAKCGTTVAALEEANGVNPRALRLGQILSVPSGTTEEGVVRESARTRADAGAAEDADSYRVGPGDTIASIAAEVGLSADALIAANEGIDLRTLQIGDRLSIPGDDEVRALLAERQAERERIERMAIDYPDPTVELREGEWRLTIDVRAEGLAPDEPVTVAIRSATSDWVTLGEMPADGSGELMARARIPGELARDRDLEIALERAGGDIVTAAYGEGARTTVTAEREPEADEPEAETVRIAGKVVRGGGCSLLIARDGRSYALTGDMVGVGAGDEILVSGAIERGSPGCVGHDSLKVSSASPLPKS
ncbi:MAG TPA: LysM peptidoglycan-binding domain-containing protein [Thermohalobaculum sp.]|nr:LysM peptidoglycan-binding domain-containing protein [Thermohalobaculum sp.]